MFKDFQFKSMFISQTPIKRICLASNGVFLAEMKRSLVISHIKGCQKTIELIDYFKNQVNVEINRFGDIANVSEIVKDENISCFALFSNFTLYLVIIRSFQDTVNNLFHLQIEKIKMIDLNFEVVEGKVQFIHSQKQNRILLLEQNKNDQLNLIQLDVSDQNFDNLTLLKHKKLQTKKLNENQGLEWKNLFGRNLVKSVQFQKFIVYNQINSQKDEQGHFAYIYSLPEQAKVSELAITYPQIILQLPSFEDDRILMNLFFVPQNDQYLLENSSILILYHTSLGVQAVQSSFSNSKTVLKKYLYSGVFVMSLIHSSINAQQIYIKGIERNLQNHTLVVKSCNGVGGENYLTLIGLPSTGGAGVLNSVLIQNSFELVKAQRQGFWINSGGQLIFVRLIKKQRIYQSLLRRMSKSGGVDLSNLLNEILQVLQ